MFFFLSVTDFTQCDSLEVHAVADGIISVLFMAE